MKLMLMYFGLLAGLLVLIFTDRQKKTPAPVEPEKYEVVLRVAGFSSQFAADTYRRELDGWARRNEIRNTEWVSVSGPEGIIDET